MISIKDMFLDLRKFYNEHYRFLLNPFYTLFDNKILSWKNYDLYQHFDLYEEYFRWVTNEFQYSIMLSDGSVIQIYAEEGQNGEIVKANYSFLPNTNTKFEYFRFDLDSPNKKDYTHTIYHVHFGHNKPEMRLSLYQFPLPSEFIKFILAALYYKKEFYNFKKTNFFPDLDQLSNRYHHFIKLKTV